MQPVDRVTQAKPLAVFAKLTQGESPVLNALIDLEVTVELKNGSIVTLPKMPLIDNGFGGTVASLCIDQIVLNEWCVCSAAYNQRAHNIQTGSASYFNRLILIMLSGAPEV